MSPARYAAAVLALFAATAAAQVAPTLAEQVDRLFRAAAKPDAPGGVVSVTRGEQVLHQQAYGLADLERQVPLAVDSVLDIGSTSKQFTAACILLLEQDGKLSLADPVKKHVPELPACCDGITVRHLMLHTSGIPDYIGLMMAAEHHQEDRTTADDALEALALVAKLEFPFGTKWAYSNSNYFLLAVIAERAGGSPLAEQAQTRIFTPLGMTSTHVHVDCTQLVSKRAFSYSRSKQGWKWNFSNWEQAGDGAVLTTVGDLVKWARNYGPGKAGMGKVGGEALLAAMSQRGALDDGKALDYGTGLMFGDLDGTPCISHGGAWAAYRAELLRVPSADLVVVCLCNRDDMNPSGLARKIAQAALQTR